MHHETKDKDTLLKYWKDDHEAPLWFREDNDTWHLTEDVFLGFCEQCWKIFEIDGHALLYVEKIGENANIHFSLLRGTPVPMDDLQELKAYLLSEFNMVFGWITKHNRGLMKVCEQLGLNDYGVRMYHGENRGKVTEWRCYSVNNSHIA